MAKKIKITEEELLEIKKEKKSHKKIFKIIGVCFSIVLNIGLIITLLVFYNNNVELEEENFDLRVERNQYKSQLGDLTGDKTYYYIQNKLDFFDDYIAFQPEESKKYYYSYDCFQEKFPSSSFWAYNLEQAKGLGLKKGSCK